MEARIENLEKLVKSANEKLDTIKAMLAHLQDLKRRTMLTEANIHRIQCNHTPKNNNNHNPNHKL